MPSGVPSGISTSPVFLTLPTSEKTLVPELAPLPVSANHAGPQSDDRGDVEPGLDVVDIGRVAPDALLRREGRARTRPAGAPFERGDQRRLLAADECAGAFDHVDVEGESASQDVLAQEAVFAGLADGDLQLMDGERILGADVDDAVRGPGDVGADRHALDQGVRIALDLVAVHVGAGIALVGVADEELALGGGLAQEFPFLTGRVAGAAPPAQAGFLDLVVGRLGLAVDQHLVEGLVAADGDVFLDVVGIDQPGVAQDDLLLAAEERHLVPQRDVAEAGAIVNVRGEMVPFLDAAQRQVGGDGLGRHVVEDSARRG